MTWWVTILFFFGGLLLFMSSGIPVAFAFLLINIFGIYIFWGGLHGLAELVISMSGAISSESYLPVITFILMGTIMFKTGLVSLIVDTLEKWVGRIPGRLSILTVFTGTILGAVCGSSMASAVTLGSTMVPEMRKRGYSKAMMVGPVLGSGGLAILIPPTTLGVVLASLAEISIGSFLMAILIPGLILATAYTIYILVKCIKDPSIAPPYEVPDIPIMEKVKTLLINLTPIGGIVFLVVGVIFLGIATPTEAASLGALGTLVLALLYKRLSWKLFVESIKDTIEISGMTLLIVSGSVAFSQLMAFSGASTVIVEALVGLAVSPLFIVALMLLAVLFLGCFISAVPIMMITIPIFMPVVYALNLNPIWFCVMFLICIEMSQITPPFGLVLYVTKGVVPKDITMGNIMSAAIPYIGCAAIVVLMILFMPQLALWLPSVMR